MPINAPITAAFWALLAWAQVSASPVDARSLVFLWLDAGAANEIVDDSGKIVRICRVEPRGRAKIGRHLVMDATGGWFEVEAAGPEIADACRGSGCFALEATLTPAAGSTSGDTPIIRLGSEVGDSNFALVQNDDRMIATLRTSLGDQRCDFGAAAVLQPAHLVITFSQGRLTALVNGKPAAQVDVGDADLSNWKQQALTFGNEGSEGGGNSNWAGTIEAVRVYSRALDATEIASHYSAHQERVGSRRPADRVVIRGRLVEISKTPTLADIAPYRRALAVSTYDILQVVDGACDAKRIQVAQWVILDRRTLPNDRAVGQTYGLTIERFEDHEELDAERLVSDSEEFDLPLFYDVSS